MASSYLAEMLVTPLLLLAVASAMGLSSPVGPGKLSPEESEQVAQQAFSVPRLPADSLLYLNPGDQLQLVWWGLGSGQVRLLVDSRSDLVVPDVGVYRVGGVRFDRVRDTLERLVRGRIRTDYVTLRVVSLAPAEVRAIGLVPQPGGYVVPAGTRLSVFLAKVGIDVNLLSQETRMTSPPKPSDRVSIPSLRNVEIVRAGGRDTIRADLVRSLRSGDFSEDPPLLSGDVVRLREQGAMIGLSGSNSDGGFFESKDGETARAFLTSHGIDPSLVGKTISIQDSSLGWKELPLDDTIPAGAATVRLNRSIRARSPQVVWVAGWVASPGAYELRDGMTSSDLVAAAGGGMGGKDSAVLLAIKRGWGWLQPGRLVSEKSEDIYPEVQSVLAEFKLHMRGNYSRESIPLQAGDSVYVYQAEHVVWVGGRVARQGYVPWKRGAKIDDYLEFAGGVAPRAWLSRVVIYDLYTGQRVSLGEDIRPGSVVLIPEKPYTPPLQWITAISTIVVSVLSSILLTQQLTN